jgi:tetratricopeptide (TPR) repeat protein
MEEARFALFDGVAALLLAATRAGPVLLVLEDLHAADPASLLLVELFAPRLRHAPLLVVATYREGEPGGDPNVGRLLARLVRVGDRLPVRGLDPDAARALAAAATDMELSGSALTALQRTSEGNPFFLRELVRVLEADGKLGGRGLASPLPVPASIRETLARRLDPLSAPTRATLAAAAVLGHDFSLGRVAALRDTSTDEALALLDPAIRDGLIVGAGAGRWRFGHGLFRDSLDAELQPSERAELHRRAADALEPDIERDPELLSEFAHHRAAAAAGGETRAAFEACVRAGDYAIRRLAFEEGAELYERALALADLGLEPIEAPRRAALVLALGEARRRAGDVAAAHDAFAGAANLARVHGLADELAHAALGFGAITVRPGETDRTLVALLEQALERLAPGRDALRARLSARLARELHFESDLRRRRELAREAVEMAKRTGDAGTRAFALSAWHVTSTDPKSSDRRLDVAREIVRSAIEADDPERELEGHVYSVVDLLELGRLDEIDGEIDACARLAARLREPALTWQVTLLEGTRALLGGRFEDAARLSEEAFQIGRAARGESARRYRFLQEVARRRECGGLEQMENDARRLADEAPERWRDDLAYLLAELGRIEEAGAVFEQLAADDFGGPVDDMVALPILVQSAEVCARLADVERAALLYERLLPHADRWVVFGPGGACAGSARRPLGLLAATLSRFDDAAGHYESAIETHRRAGALPLVARSEEGLARVLRQRGDRQRADQLLVSALHAASALGMTRLVERIEALESGPAAATAPASPRGGLRLEGDYWTAEFGDTTVRLRDRKGLRYLARLLAEPHREIAALELVTGGLGAAGTPLGATEELGVRGATADHAGELLDQQAKRAYRQRIVELREELDEARAFNDPERAERAETELEFVSGELARAVGFGGRDRKAASAVERARLSVTRAIRSAIDHVGQQHPELGRHLDSAVRTGTYCRYAPPPDDTVSWDIHSH